MLILSNCSRTNGTVSRLALSDGEVVGHLDRAAGDSWKGSATAEAPKYQPLLDELALHVAAGTLQRPTGDRDRAIVVDYPPQKGFTLTEEVCTTPQCAKQRTVFRFLMSSTPPWRVKPGRVFCFACGATYRVVVPNPSASVGKVRAIREGE